METMPARPTHPAVALAAPGPGAAAHADSDRLRALVIAAGIFWSVVFIGVGLRYQLQLYGDGAMFSYSVAAQDAWAFHWHNISGRLTVYLLTLLPAEAFVGLTGDPGAGIFVYGLLFFMAPLLGLIATYAADRSKGRIIFLYACFSTACLCPLVFGFPTEMWLAHALFWPALAVANSARRTAGGTMLLFALLLMLILTHEGALVLAAAIVATLLLRGIRDKDFLSAAGALVAAVLVWGTVKAIIRPDAYFADVLARAALDFFDLNIFTGDLVRLLFATIAGYGVVFLVLARLMPARAHIYATLLVAAALAAYWIFADHGLHAADRYYLRTLLVIGTPIFGGLAAIHAFKAAGRTIPAMPGLERIAVALSNRTAARAVSGVFLLVMLVHAVETAKFVTAWTQYKAAVAALATGTTSDPPLGDPQFVSSDRIGAELNRLSWYSTTPYLSVIVANFAPNRLIVDPRAYNYFWLSCRTASENLEAKRTIPAEGRRLVRILACLHR
jgi:hypothetical protein